MHLLLVCQNATLPECNSLGPAACYVLGAAGLPASACTALAKL
jgi:hypothetical protein